MSEWDALLKRIEILSNEKYEANLALRLQKDLETKAQALAASRLELLRRTQSWLDVALIHLKDHPDLLGNVQDLKKEISRELGDD